MGKVRLKFGHLVPSNADDFGTITQTVYQALEAGRVFRKTESLVLFFMDPRIETLDGREILVTYFAHAQGLTYRAPDPETGNLAQHTYDSPPFKSRTLVILDEYGNLVIEAKKSQYIDPIHVVDALDKTIRRHGDFSSAFSLTLKDLPGRSTIFEDALRDLKRLDVVAVDDLRHSNPRPRSAHYDAVADQRIHRIRYASKHAAGIDRDHEEFKSFLGHVREYAVFEEVAGLGEHSYEILRAEGGELELTVEIAAEEEDARVREVYRYFVRYSARHWGSGAPLS